MDFGIQEGSKTARGLVWMIKMSNKHELPDEEYEEEQEYCQPEQDISRYSGCYGGTVGKRMMQNETSAKEEE